MVESSCRRRDTVSATRLLAPLNVDHSPHADDSPPPPLHVLVTIYGRFSLATTWIPLCPTLGTLMLGA